MNTRFVTAMGALALMLVCNSPAKTVEFFNSADGFSDTQGKNGWSYACANTRDTGDLWTSQMMLAYVASTQTWQKSLPGGPIIKITATQQNKYEGAGIVSLRYWTAERDYKNVVISSTLLATVPLSAYLAKVDAATRTTTPLTSKWYATAASLANSGGQQTLSIGTTLPSLRKGDRIYFILRNEGTGAGHGTAQTWDQTIRVEGSTLYGVHAQSRPDSLSPYLDKAHSIYALGGPDVYVRDWWSWDFVQPTGGAINWTIPDQAVAKAQALGQKLVVCLCFTPAWANAGKGRTWPADDPQDWVDFLRAVAARYKNSGVIKGWELWNEQNTPLFLANGLTGSGGLTAWQVRADLYAEKLLIPGYAAIRSVDSFTPVLFGGVTYTGTASNGVDNTVHGFVRRVLSHPAARDSFDYAGYHPYTTPERIPSIFDQLENLLHSHGIDRPIAVTEWGALSPAGAEATASRLAQTASILKTRNVTHAFLHYSVDAEGVMYGLFERTVAQPASLNALHRNDWRMIAHFYANVIARLAGHDYEGPAAFAAPPPVPTTAYAYRHAHDPAKSVIALWHSGNSPQDLEVLVGADAVSAQLNAWDGTTFTHTPVPLTGTGAARKALVTVTGSPRFLKIQH